VADSGVHRAAGGEDALPGVAAEFEGFVAGDVALGQQLLAEGGDRVVVVVHRVAERQQVSLLGVEEEDHAHDHRGGGLVHAVWGDALDGVPTGLEVGSTDGRDHEPTAWRASERVGEPAQLRRWASNASVGVGTMAKKLARRAGRRRR
jgi:hypothetical protein